jgi:Ca-activated chloride channel homolog
MFVLWAVIEFEAPARLGWLALLPLLAYFAWRSRTTLPPPRRLASFACRALSVTLLVLAFAGIAVRGTSDRRQVMLLVDRSRSVQGDGQRAADRFIDAVRSAGRRHEVVVWEFADRPVPETNAAAAESPALNPLVSDLAAAVRMAAASAPDRLVPQIVLLSDGNETQGQVARAALGAGMPIDVVPLPSFSEPDACVIELTPSSVDPVSGQVPVEAFIYSNHAGPARLHVTLDDRIVADRPVDLHPGENRFSLAVPARSAGNPVVQVTLQAASDSIPENNVRRLRLRSPEPSRMLLIADQPEQQPGFRDALAGDRFTVDALAPDRLPGLAADLADYDVIVLANVSPLEIDARVDDALEQYVRRGGGLIAVGGDRTFGHAAYHQSRLEQLLPVTAAEEVESRKPVLAIMLVIDRSGSMVEENRMELAKLAARQSVELLEPEDQAGVMAFSDGPLWVAEMTQVGDDQQRQQLLQAIDTLQPAGQTNMYGAVERAFLALNQTVADRRYMILLTDGIPSPGDYLEIANRMASQGITLSTVSLGHEAEQDLMIEMARIAGGRHYHCDDPKDVPGVMVRETRAATADDTPQRFETTVFRALPGLPTDGAPPLAGYAVTNPKPRAEQLLMAAGRDPLLAWWPLDAGIAVALTCDPHGPGNRDWQKWPGYPDFWQRLVRHAARRPAPPEWKLSVSRQGAAGWVRLETVSHPPATELPEAIPMRLETPAGESRDLILQAVVGGRYEAGFAAMDLGEYRIGGQLDSSDGPAQSLGVSLWIDYPDELRLGPDDVVLLQAIAASTGGRFNPPVETLLAPDGRTVPRCHAPWRPLMLAALLLILADLAIRRVRF